MRFFVFILGVVALLLLVVGASFGLTAWLMIAGWGLTAKSWGVIVGAFFIQIILTMAGQGTFKALANAYTKKSEDKIPEDNIPEDIDHKRLAAYLNARQKK